MIYLGLFPDFRVIPDFLVFSIGFLQLVNCFTAFDYDFFMTNFLGVNINDFRDYSEQSQLGVITSVM